MVSTETSGSSHPPADDPAAVRAFRAALHRWFDDVARALPWREDPDPYRVWLSEIMLQQTRVDQAMPYWLRFVERFPDVRDLAEAPLDDVLRLWEGLGYYSRARNLHRAAREVVDRFGGRLPADHAALRSLPGVGDYTAAAVASIAFGLPEAAVDGNVIRVLTRLFAEDRDVTRAAVRRTLRERAALLLDPGRPGRHNEAMMELGATVCTPRSPSCDACPVRAHCMARVLGDPEAFPVKRRRSAVPHHDVAVGIVRAEDGRLLIQRRPEDGMLGGLWEFPGGKCEPGELPSEACRRELHEELGIEVAVGSRVAEIRHAYSHFRITLHAFPCRIRQGLPESRNGQDLRWVARDQLSDYAFPRANRKLITYLSDHDPT